MRISDWSSDVCSSDLYFGYHPIERQWRPPVWQGRSVRGQRGTTARAAYVVLVVSTVGGCEDNAAGFGAGFGRAIGLLLLLGLVLPGTVVGLVVLFAGARRRRRDQRAAPPPPPSGPGEGGWPRSGP